MLAVLEVDSLAVVKGVVEELTLGVVGSGSYEVELGQRYLVTVVESGRGPGQP